MKAMLDFLNDNQGALMVLITAVYVIATIVITVANIKAAKATRAQIAESRWQYEDRKRLEIMPFIQFETSRTEAANHVLSISCPAAKETILKAGSKFFQIKNIGLGTAKDIRYSFSWADGIECCKDELFPIHAMYSNEVQQIKVLVSHPRSVDKEKEIVGTFIFTYSDLLDNKYEQEMKVKYKEYDISFYMQELFITSPVRRKKENKNA